MVAEIVLTCFFAPLLLGPLLALIGLVLWAIPPTQRIAGPVAVVGVSALVLYWAAAFATVLVSVPIGWLVPALRMPAALLAWVVAAFVLMVRSRQVADFLAEIPVPAYFGLLSDGRWVAVRRRTVRMVGVYMSVLMFVGLIEAILEGGLA